MQPSIGSRRTSSAKSQNKARDEASGKALCGFREGSRNSPCSLTRRRKKISNKLMRWSPQPPTPPASLQQTLATTVAFFLEKKDPVRKAQRAASSRISKAQKGSASPVTPQSPGQRKKTADVAHQVNLRDGFRCAYLYQDGS